LHLAKSDKIPWTPSKKSKISHAASFPGVLRIWLVAAAALAAALVAAGGVSVVVEVGDDDRVGGARPRDAVAHRHQNNLHAAVERVEVRLPKDRRQWIATQRLAHQAAQLFRSVVEPRTFKKKLDYGYGRIK
jgi:hypothetical protein